MRNSLVLFHKRPSSQIKTWLGERKARKPNAKITKPLFKHRSKTLRGKTVY